MRRRNEMRHTTRGVWLRHWFETVESELIQLISGPSLLLFFFVKFQLPLFVLSSLAIELLLLEIMEAMRSIPLQVSIKVRRVFFACCFEACTHGEIVEGVLPSEGLRKFSKCLPDFLDAWPFLDRTTFTVRCCSRSLGLSFATCLDLAVSFPTLMLRLVQSDSRSTHINTLHTLRTHTDCERALSCLATRKKKKKVKTEVKKVECLLLHLGRCTALEQAVHDQLL